MPARKGVKSSLPVPPTVPGFGDQSPAAGADMSMLINLQMLKMLKRMNNGGDSSDSDGLEGQGYSGKASGFSDIIKMRKEIVKKPERSVKAYNKMVKEGLGVFDERQYWSHAQWALRQRPRFKQMLGLWCSYYGYAHLLDTSQANGGNPRLEAEIAAQLRTLLQVATDRGGWDNALLLTPYADPLHSQAFGGEDCQMEAVAKFQKAQKELAAKVTLGQPSHADEPEDDGGEGGESLTRAQKFRAAQAARKEKQKKDAAAAAAAASGEKKPG